MKNSLRSLTFLALLLSAAAAMADNAADAIDVREPYVRAVPPGQRVSAAFMTLGNRADVAHALVAVESPVADTVELHSHTLKDGMMQMREVEQVPVPAGQSTRLQPGGLHVMLIGLRHQLKPGEEADLTLVFEDGSRKQVKAPVHKIGVMMQPAGKHMMP